tara:strand:- start:563 stop:1405 length:843 start_codon:yes stop_codon:yes gene_type:complete
MPFMRPKTNRADQPDRGSETGALSGVMARPSRRPSLRSIMTGAMILGGLAAGVVLYIERASLSVAIIDASANSGLHLQTIEVQGRAHTSKDVLMAVSELTLGQPMLTISLPELHDRLSTIGWVKDVAIERRMPSTIRLILTERVPMALLQTEGGHRVIDKDGEIISGADPSAFGHLTVVAGTSAGVNAAPLLNILRTEPELFAEVWAVTYQSERRWDVHLRNGIRVRLPETDPRTAWSRLAIIDHSKQITDRDLAVIDLRVPDQMIVEPNIPVRGRGRET